MNNNDKNKKIKVLLAEDEDILRRIYLTKFETEGLEVFAAINGEEAFELAIKNEPDIILLDVIMPKADGFFTLKKLKENEKTKDIPVMMLTNLAQNGDLEEGKKLGAIDYLVKADLTPLQVVQKIKEFLKK
ncbi:MAG: response regulator [Bacteroidetes bacterium]|nr:response regulator [Bacteroidota bacterium]